MWATLAAAWLAATHSRLGPANGIAHLASDRSIRPALATLAAAALAVAFVGFVVVMVAIRRNRLDAARPRYRLPRGVDRDLRIALGAFTSIIFLLRDVTFDPPA